MFAIAFPGVKKWSKQFSRAFLLVITAIIITLFVGSLFNSETSDLWSHIPGSDVSTRYIRTGIYRLFHLSFKCRGCVPDANRKVQQKLPCRMRAWCDIVTAFYPTRGIFHAPRCRDSPNHSQNQWFERSNRTWVIWIFVLGFGKIVHCDFWGNTGLFPAFSKHMSSWLKFELWVIFQDWSQVFGTYFVNMLCSVGFCILKDN